MTTTAVQRHDQPIQTTPSLPPQVLTSIQGIMPNLPALLPPDISLAQFRAATWLELRQVRGLEDCSGESVATALVEAANAGLLPGRDCHIIPFTNPRNRRKEATLVPNYQGLILTLERSGKVKKAFAHAVYSADTFEVDYLADVFSHKPSLRGERGVMECVYGCILEKDGTKHFEVMSLGQIDAIKARAPGHESGPWTTDYEEMARKTALKRVMKFVRLSPQQQQLLESEAEQESLERFRSTVADIYGEPRDMPNVAREYVKDQRTPGAATIHPPTPTLDRPGEKFALAPDDPPPAPATAGQTFIDQITAVMQAAGESEDSIQAYWHATCRRCKVSSPSAIKAAWLPKLLEERREHYARKAVAPPAVPPWRETLAEVSQALQEPTLLAEVWGALDDASMPEDVGQALVARVQAHMAEMGGQAAE